MPVFTKKEGFVKQVAIFLRDEENAKAYALAREMVSAYPGDMISHYLFAKSALRIGGYDEAVFEGRKAYDMARQREDMIACALLIACALYLLGKYQDGYRVLLLHENDKHGSVDQMLLIFAVAIGDPDAASKHAQELLRINRKAARKMISSFIE